MAKKILVLLIAVMLLFCITSCGSKDESYLVTFKVNGAEYASCMVSNQVVDLPTPDVPKELQDTHMFYGWYFINPKTGQEVTVHSEYFTTNPLTEELTLHAKFGEKLVVSYNKNKGGYYVDSLGKKGVLKEITIPEKYTTSRGTYDIVGISKEAFSGESALVKITLPKTIKEISTEAFEGCTALETLTVQSGVTTLGSRLFNGVNTIKTINASSDIIAQIDDKTQLISATINDGTAIKDGCFASATNLTELNINSKIETVGAKAFANCSSIKKISLPVSVTDISIDAFINCPSLESLSVASNDKYYSNSAKTFIIRKDGSNNNTLIAACKGSNGNVTIDSNINKIEKYAFHGVAGLKNLVIDSAVVEINPEAFDGCTAIESIKVKSTASKFRDYDGNYLVNFETGLLVLGCKNSVISENDGVTSISEYAFRYCTGLKSIYIPSTVSEILHGTFAGCTALESVAISSESNGLVIADDAFVNCAKISKITLPVDYVPYFAANMSASLKDVVINAGTEIPANLLADSGVATVVIESDVTLIGESAFAGCKSLKSIVIGDDVTEIRHHAFDGCSALSAVKVSADDANGFVVPATINAIGEYAFQGTGLGSLEVNHGIYLGYKVFGGCSSLNSVKLVDEVTANSDAFASCSGVANLVAPAHLIKNFASSGARAANVSITSGKIDAYAFLNWTGLKNLYIGSGVTEIAVHAFDACANLATVTSDNSRYQVIGNSNCLVEGNTVVLGTVNVDFEALGGEYTVASYAFSGSNISNLTIPKGWVINAYAFENCAKLATVVINVNDAESIADTAFYSCNGVETAVIPTFLTDKFNWPVLKSLTITDGAGIPKNAFLNCSLLETVVLPNNPTFEIGSNAFKGCIGVKTLTVASVANLDSFKDAAIENLVVLNAGNINGEFSHLIALKELTLPSFDANSNGEYTVAANAVGNSKFLTVVNVPVQALVGMNTEIIVKLVVNSGSFDSMPAFDFNSLATLIVSGSAEVSAKCFIDAPELMSIVTDNSDLYTASGNCLISNGILVLAAKTESVPSGVNAIGEYAYAGRYITNITIPSNVTAIGYKAFAECVALVECSVKGSASIASEAFATCLYLAKVSLADGVTLADNKTFTGCYSLATLSIPASIIDSIVPGDALTTLEIISGEIGAGKIWTTRALSTLIIGKNVTAIAPGAISGNNNLTVITVADGNSDFTGKDNCVLTKDGKVLVLGCSTSVIPASVTKIAAQAFKGCVGMTAISIPASITVIETEAFVGCSSVASIVVDAANKNYSSVNNCLLTKDGKTLVLGCKTSDIPDTVTEIAEAAFKGSGVTAVYIPAGVASVGASAFEDCKSLTKVVFKEGSKLTSFSDRMFANCTDLEKVVLPAGVTKVAGTAFAECSYITVYYTGTTANKADCEAVLAGVANNVAKVSYYNASYQKGCWMYQNNDIFEY